MFLDGTLSREDLALKLGCSPDEIQVVRQAIPKVGNLELIQVSDIGRAGMSRGGDQLKRTAAIVEHYQALDPNQPGSWTTKSLRLMVLGGVTRGA